MQDTGHQEVAVMEKAEKGDAGREGNQSEILRQSLGEEIMTGLLRPGEFLSETRIAERFGVSRTPVREAIRSLAGDGLVTLRLRQRAVVRGQTAAEILDQFEAMAELEAACARLAARRCSAAQLSVMEQAQADCCARADAADVDLYYEANVRLHEAIYSAAGNAYLRAETKRLRDRLRFLRMSQGSLPGRVLESSREHETVLTAIRARDETGAADAMRAHLIVQGESLRSMLRHTDASGIVHLQMLQHDRGQASTQREEAS